MIANGSKTLNTSIPVIEGKFVCRACHRSFVIESRYLQHRCTQMKREDELKSPQGQAAWNFYQVWFKHQKRLPPPATTFLTSKYFRTFANFVELVKRVDMPTPEKFIWLMVQKNYPPAMWMSNDAYATYVEFLDRKTTPMDQFKLSLQTLLDITDRYDVDISNVFDVIPPHEIIRLLNVRRLSPWLLLFSKQFQVIFRTKMTPDQKIMTESLIRPEYWSEKKQEYSEDVILIKKYVQELKL